MGTAWGGVSIGFRIGVKNLPGDFRRSTRHFRATDPDRLASILEKNAAIKFPPEISAALFSCASANRRWTTVGLAAQRRQIDLAAMARRKPA